MVADSNVIGSNIKRLRKLYGETQAELGAAIGYSNTTVSSYESGRLRNPDTISRIARHYGVSSRVLESESIDIAESNVSETVVSYLALVSMNLVRFFSGASPKESDFHKACDECIAISQTSLRAERLFGMEERISHCLGVFLANWGEYPAEARANYASGLVLTWMLTIDPPDSVIREAAKKDRGMALTDIMELSPQLNDAVERHGFPEKDRFVRERDAEMSMCLCELRQYPEWADYADFYSAMLYMAGFVDPDLGLERISSTEIGVHMLLSQAKLGNNLSQDFLFAMLDASDST